MFSICLTAINSERSQWICKHGKNYSSLCDTRQSRLVYCKTRRVLSTKTIGKVGFQSKQWIGCRPNHSLVYTAKVGVRGTLGLCNRRVLIVLCVQISFRVFFWWFWSFIQRNWYNVCYLKYCPSLSTIFDHLSGSIRIPRFKNSSSFEAIQESTQFLASS